MVMFNVLLNDIVLGITSAFGWAETIFSKFGLTLITLIVVMAGTAFFVRHFVGSMLK